MIALSNIVLSQLTRYAAWIGMLFLLCSVLLTTIDVILRKVDGEGIYGAIDLVQLMIMYAAFLSIPYTFMKRAHVAVSVITDRMSQRMISLTEVLGTVLGFGFMGAVGYFGFLQTLQQMEYGDVSMIFGMPMIYYWIPLLIGSLLSALVCCQICLESLYSFVTGRFDLTREVK
jgi:TRAP-type C4-dicarboxylate transport system permease small subunit